MAGAAVAVGPCAVLALTQAGEGEGGVDTWLGVDRSPVVVAEAAGGQQWCAPCCVDLRSRAATGSLPRSGSSVMWRGELAEHDDQCDLRVQYAKRTRSVGAA